MTKKKLFLSAVSVCCLLAIACVPASSAVSTPAMDEKPHIRRIISEKTPGLTWLRNNKGLEGWVWIFDLNAGMRVKTPEEAIAWTEAHPPVYMYLEDGCTVIGTYLEAGPKYEGPIKTPMLMKKRPTELNRLFQEVLL